MRARTLLKAIYARITKIFEITKKFFMFFNILKSSPSESASFSATYKKIKKNLKKLIKKFGSLKKCFYLCNVFGNEGRLKR